MPLGGAPSERYEVKTSLMKRDRSYGTIVRNQTFSSLASNSFDPEANCSFILEDDLDKVRASSRS